MTTPALPAVTIDTADNIIDAHWPQDRALLRPYRNHVLRMMSFCIALQPGIDPFELGVAGGFHDLAVWSVPTWDYLKPSRELARAWLTEHGRSASAERVEAMIENHHKVTRYRGPHEAAVEAFRRADWMDVTRGRLRFGLPAQTIKAIRRAHPNLGFHVFLRRRTLHAFAETPMRPLPMLRW